MASRNLQPARHRRWRPSPFVQLQTSGSTLDLCLWRLFLTMLLPKFVDQSAHYDQIIEVDQRTLCKAERNPNTEVTVYPCRWDTHGGACQRWIEGDEREILTHLRKYHDVQGQTKDPILCKWSGCSEELKNGSIPRHIMTHVKVALRCSKCRMKFPRKDRIQNHRRMVEECANANIETVPGPEARLIRIEP
ncbi:hypothetical protein EV401DRAFT_1077000 [Pisolithus croceorrhizus]|nr:hypothetical protein EV401DRAFT_1077000 [Pisolithus croceorrhizus]